MAWKNKMQYEWLAEEHQAEGLSDLCDVVKSLYGRSIRVTVEEEVNECCEYWRGCGEVITKRDATFYGEKKWRKVSYCPECGRRL